MHPPRFRVSEKGNKFVNAIQFYKFYNTNKRPTANIMKHEEPKLMPILMLPRTIVMKTNPLPLQVLINN